MSLLQNHTEVQLACGIYTWGGPFIFIGGLATNILTLIVLLRHNLRRVTTCAYLFMLAVMDTLALFMYFLRWIDTFDNLASTWICKVWVFLTFFSTQYSMCCISVVTLERFLIIKYPLEAKSWITMKRTRIVIFVLAIIYIIVNHHHFYTVEATFEHSQERYKCTIINRPQFIYFWTYVQPVLHAFLYSYIPLIIVHRVNAAIIAHLRIYDTNLEETTRSSSTGLVHKHGPQVGSKQLPRMLMLIAISFTCLTLPTTVLTVIKWIVDYKDVSDISSQASLIVADVVAGHLKYTHHAINFWLYCFSGKKFRNELRQVLNCECATHTAEARSGYRPDVAHRRSNTSIRLHNTVEDMRHTSNDTVSSSDIYSIRL